MTFNKILAYIIQRNTSFIYLNSCTDSNWSPAFVTKN